MAIACLIALFLAFVAVLYVALGRNEEPIYASVAAGHGDAPRSMPLADPTKALPCIECPHLRASRQQPSPANPAFQLLVDDLVLLHVALDSHAQHLFDRDMPDEAARYLALLERMEPATSGVLA